MKNMGKTSGEREGRKEQKPNNKKKTTYTYKKRYISVLSDSPAEM